MKKINFSFAAASLIIILIFSGCTQASAAQAQEDMMLDIESVEVAGKAPDSDFINAQMNFGLNLFKECYKERESENILISPLSAVPTLAMTANGAKGETLKEMEELLGGDMTIDQLNEYLKYYLNSLKNDNEDGFKLSMANSVWFKGDDENLTIEKDFLQTNASYYGAEIYKAPFDNSTVKSVNDWVSKNTDKMIPKIIDSFNDEDIMCLINALAFEAKWSNVYTKDQIHDGTFTAADGREQRVKMMSSREYVYLQDENATGFLKSYKGERFSFGALLPSEGISVEQYISSLTAEGLLKTLTENAEKCEVITKLPKFKSEYSANLTQPLINIGIPAAFDLDNADFSKLGKYQSRNIGIDRVLQKTFIQVDEKGTKAGAVTAAAVAGNSAAPLGAINEVILDRPFIYMIIDNDTGIPLFLGTAGSID